MTSTPEFDRFGPWIDEVHDAGDLPRLYQGALDPAAYRLVLKVPRDIERRNAHPGMHLYDYVLAVDPEHLTVLRRRDDAYDTIRVPLDGIAAIADSVRLLNGRLLVHTVDGQTVAVAYNGSANAPIRDLVRLLRSHYLPADVTGSTGVEQPAGEVRLGREDTGLVTDYRRLTAEEPAMRLVNASPRRVAVPLAPLERLYRLVWPTTLHASIVAADDREIQILHRRDWFTGGGDDLSTARTVLPRARITDIRLGPHPRYRDVHLLIVDAGATRLEFPLASGPLTEAIRSGAAVTL
ncbi:hypothetical protein [Actinoplanes rectilineatus]|uniref:hypothetical protein n=1 Tax=Actinoplanes rectilineatus TaxID=113571 RepID=UPI00069712A6|nr:hypothetical protein [Actinoplanes rectilineatus]